VGFFVGLSETGVLVEIKSPIGNLGVDGVKVEPAEGAPVGPAVAESVEKEEEYEEATRQNGDLS
jgi:hypothetical protein